MLQVYLMQNLRIERADACFVRAVSKKDNKQQE